MNAMELWEFLFRIYLVLLALLVVSFLFQRPSSIARPITIISLVLIVVPVVILVVLIRLEWEPF